jgi:tyrosinase
MTTSNPLRVRWSVRELQAQYDAGNKKPLEDLVRAWIGIKNLPPTDPRSFFVLGGYHGEPFEYRKPVDALPEVDTYTYWGGYCNHGNVLFPTWHRVYVLKLEQALQSIVPDVMMPYWDETSAESLEAGIPAILTQQTFELDGKTIDNPLRSFVLPDALSDDAGADDELWKKPKGYETVRYPLSGLVGTPAARKITAMHNARYPDPVKNTAYLNANVTAWLQGRNPTPTDPHPTKDGVLVLFEHCLRAPNYTVFSNTTSAAEWGLSNAGVVTALESPHNDIHLAVGGFDVPSQGGEFGQIAGANGDMGENNTAGLDPIFFFHHCNVDRVFWLWQKQNGHTDELEIIRGYKGTSSSDAQGPTPGIAPGTELDLKTPLYPFKKSDGSDYTSEDCINIEKQLGFTYSRGSLEQTSAPAMLAQGASPKKLTVRGVDRALFQGSFVIRAFAAVKDASGASKEHYLGHYSVLSRRNVVRCANCLTHLEVVAHFPLGALPADSVDGARFRIEVQYRGSGVPSEPATPLSAGELSAAAPRSVAGALPARFKADLEVRD